MEDLVKHLGAFDELTRRMRDVELRQSEELETLTRRLVEVVDNNMEYQQRFIKLESEVTASRATRGAGPLEVPGKGSAWLEVGRADRAHKFSQSNNRGLRGPAIRQGSADPAPDSVSGNTHKHTLLSLSLSLSLSPSLPHRSRPRRCV